jgi:RsiW-degrading membrane proteinase PrsW (M82 family)
MKNKSSSSNKNTVIIGIILVVVLAGVWYFYSKGNSAPSTSQLVSSTSGTSAATAAVGDNVLTMLNNVSSIHIDSNFFSTPAYQSLVDYSIVVPPQAVGRQNPFAPVGQ